MLITSTLRKQRQEVHKLKVSVALKYSEAVLSKTKELYFLIKHPNLTSQCQ